MFIFFTACVKIHSYLDVFLYLSATLASCYLLSVLERYSTIYCIASLNPCELLAGIDWMILMILQSSLYRRLKSLKMSESNKSRYRLSKNTPSDYTRVFSSCFSECRITIVVISLYISMHIIFSMRLSFNAWFYMF